MTTAPVTPVAALTTAVVTGGTAVTVFPAGVAGGRIVNPYDATEEIFINPVDSATTDATGNTFALQPGQEWSAIPGQTTPTTVNALTNGHEFSAVYWNED